MRNGLASGCAIPVVSNKYLPVSLIAMAALALGGCDYSPYTYSATGALKDASGSPLVHQKLMLDSPLPDAPNPPRSSGEFLARNASDYVREHSAVTDEEGRFSASFIGGEMYSGFNFCPPPAPELREIYIWVNCNFQWDPIIVRLDRNSQTRAYPGGRHIHLPPVVVPQLTRPASQASAEPTATTPRLAR